MVYLDDRLEKISAARFSTDLAGTAQWRNWYITFNNLYKRKNIYRGKKIYIPIVLHSLTC